MTRVELPASVLPTLNEDGGYNPPEMVFSVTKLNEMELGRLTRFVSILMIQAKGADKDPNQETWNVRTQFMVETFPWIEHWAETVDAFLLEHKDTMTPQVLPGEGFGLKLFLYRGSEDHMDIPRLRPAALSIGLEGERELVGVTQPTPEQTVELSAKLLRDRTVLRKLDDVDGVPVQRVTQRPGDVVTIGNYCTLHSGFPVNRSAALAVARYGNQEGPDPQYVVDHYNQFFPDA